MNFIRTMIFLKYKIKVVYHFQMGQDNNLVERHSLSSEFHMLKWSNIYGFGTINLSLDCLVFWGEGGGHTSTLPPSGPATDHSTYRNAYPTWLKRKWHFRILPHKISRTCMCFLKHRNFSRQQSYGFYGKEISLSGVLHELKL